MVGSIAGRLLLDSPAAPIVLAARVLARDLSTLLAQQGLRARVAMRIRSVRLGRRALWTAGHQFRAANRSRHVPLPIAALRRR